MVKTSAGVASVIETLEKRAARKKTSVAAPRTRTRVSAERSRSRSLSTEPEPGTEEPGRGRDLESSSPSSSSLDLASSPDEIRLGLERQRLPMDGANGRQLLDLIADPEQGQRHPDPSDPATTPPRDRKPGSESAAPQGTGQALQVHFVLPAEAQAEPRTLFRERGPRGMLLAREQPLLER
ncbi:unnamed protein product [Bemisia tabaci]|uniref:Uncharacterized protein n=1 Tax=Bemisia tabaci TaxID=7038 RepID=A0A9P0A1H7_BEMTA|nr:unnamed protein product [Bemisia tabaci]